MDDLNRLIETWATRARLQRSLAWVLFGLACGLGAGVLFALAARVFPIATQPQVILASVVSIATGVLVAALAPWIRTLRVDTLRWARAFDQQFGIGERVTTALELRDGVLTNATDALRILQQADAMTAARAVDPRALLPLRLNKRHALASLVLALALALAVLLPNAQEQVAQQRAELRQTLNEQAKAIEDAKQVIQDSPFLSDAQKQQALNALDEAKRALEDPNVTPEKALAAINDAQTKLDALRDQLAEQQRADLQRAGRTLTPDQLTNAMSDAMQRGDFDRAADMMRNLTNQNGQPLAESERQRLANQLDQMARQVQSSDQQMAQNLRQAAQQLRQGQAEQARESLNRAAQSLDRANSTQSQEGSISEAQQRAEQIRRELSRAMSQQQAGQPGEAGQSEAGQAGSTESESFEPGQAGQDGQAGSQGDMSEAMRGMTGDPGEGFGQGEAGKFADGAQGTDASGQSQHSEDSGSSNTVTVPNSRITTQGETVVLPDLNPAQRPDPQGRQQPAAAGQSSVPYQQVYGQYAQAADEALQNGEVPVSMRDLVRDYFSSLDPNQNR